MNVTLWALQILLALSFVSAGAQKLAGSPYMVDLFTKIGAGQWLRYAIGLIELAGAIGLVLPPLSGRAALGLTALMVGATATNLFIGYSPWVPLGFLLASALVAWGRWLRTTALPVNLHR